MSTLFQLANSFQTSLKREEAVLDNQTRLISIVSKPIMVVFVIVVIDVVFVNKNKGPKKILVKKRSMSRKLKGNKVVVQKKCCPKN